MKRIYITDNSQLSKVQQIVDAIVKDVDKGVLKKDYHLPSINVFSKQNKVARDTVEKAYNRLKELGYVTSVNARGYFINGKPDGKLKILLVFNKLSSYKKIIYDSFIRTLGNDARVDLQVHHYSPAIFREIVTQNLGKYHYYVIMPHFLIKAAKKDYLNTIKMIPDGELMLLDKNIPEAGKKHMAVYQDFENDIYEVLISSGGLLDKYKKIVIVFPAYSNHPDEIIEGTRRFCHENKKQFAIIDSADNITLERKTAYIVISESDLAKLIKQSRSSGLQAGKDIGVISFNETELKDLLDITVITTDFERMGEEAARMILDKRYEQLRNPFRMIVRHSL